MVVVFVTGTAYCEYLGVCQFFKQNSFVLGRIGKSNLPDEIFQVQFESHQTDLLVDHLTKHYNEDLMIDCFGLPLDSLFSFKERRPYFYTLFLDTPPNIRYQCYLESFQSKCLRINGNHDKSADSVAKILSLEEFLSGEQEYFYEIRQSKNIRWISLGQKSIFEVFSAINFKEEVRPSWDRYFMQLARHTSSRSNCMKRKVGCIVEKNHRVIAAGYNGTPYPMRNCNDGGCPRCNNPEIRGGQRLEECFCIHAEENALLECGKAAFGATLYCSTCPCIGCAKKIVQVGIARVFYSDTFHMDAIAHFIFDEAKIEIRQFKYE